MRPRKLRRLVGAAACTMVLAGTGIGWAADVHADELTFLQALNNNGITVYDTSLALGWGLAICEALNTTPGDVVAANFYRITNWDVPDPYTAAVWVVVAAEQLCPWNDHRGQVMA